MTTKRIMPSLSTDGWVSDPVQVADYLMSHFFLSEFSQTALFPKQVSSLPYIVYENQGSPTRTAEKVKTTLTTYFSRYFDNVVVQTSYRDDSEDPSKSIIDCFIEYVDSDGKTHSFSKSAELVNGKFNKIVYINNYVGEG